MVLYTHEKRFVFVVSDLVDINQVGAWIAQWIKHSLDTAATQDRIPMSVCDRVVVARPRSLVFPGFPGFLHHV